MIAAIICLVLATVLLASVLKLASTGRKQVRRQQWRLQAEWLTESGLERAASRLAGDAAYEGETWNIAAEDLDGRHKGLVVIKVEASDDSPNARSVHIEASYPAGSTVFAKRSRQATVSTAGEP